MTEYEPIPKLEMITLTIEIKNIMNPVRSFNTTAGFWFDFLLIFSPPITRNSTPTPI